MKCKFNLILILLIISTYGYSQKRSNANEISVKYDEFFLYGSNMDYKNGNWSDAEVADILTGNPEKNIVGVGANSLRPALYEYYLEKNGYDNRVPSFQHYKKMGAVNNVIFIGDRPSSIHQEDNYYCTDDNGNIIKEERVVLTDKDGNPLKGVDGNDSVRITSYRSKSYKNLYEPIWILKDTIINNKKTQIEVINQNNYYAYYVYRLVNTYKDYAKFYEVKNEPDYTSTGEGNLKKGELSFKKHKSWWDNDPHPRALKNFYAPIQNYVRLLRVSYEVIKSLDPDALVCIGGIGYVSFLDAVLRNTDNPDGGKVTEEYPYTGGAWFDCLSYHNYPMYYLDTWVGRDYPGNIDGKIYSRHTDAAVDELIKHQKEFESLLETYGYDGVKYPRKITIVTETNVSNKPVGKFIGGEDQQRNYLLKAAVVGQANGLKGLFPYCPWDFKSADDPTGNEYDYKGFYYPVPESPELNDSIVAHDSAEGWRTISSLMGDKKYDEALSMNISNDSIRGAGFSNERISAYALWARTTKDMDETASATFQFPDSIFPDKNNKIITEIKWNPSKRDYVSNIIEGTTTVQLTGDVAFYCPAMRHMPVTHIKFSETVHLMDVGDTVQLYETIYPSYAYDKRVKWSTNDSTIAIVDSKGLVKALKEGVVHITASTLDNSKSASCEIVVGKPDGIAVKGINISLYEAELCVGDTIKLDTRIYPYYASKQDVEWYSSNSNIAEVDSEGLVTAKQKGIAWINVKALHGPNGQMIGPATCRVVVSENSTDIQVEKIVLDMSTVEINVGNTLKLTATISPSNATNKSVIWYSHDNSIATVDNGLVIGVKEGVAWINVRTEDGNKIATAKVTVIKDNIVHVERVELDKKTMAVNVGGTSKLTATVIPINAKDKSIIWYSSDDRIATVNEEGIVTGVKEGIAWINAKTLDGYKVATCQVSVLTDKIDVEMVELDITTAEINIGETLKLTATVSPSDAMNKTVIWYSHDNTIVTVEDGLVTGVKEGIAWVNVKTEDGNKVATAKVTVVNKNRRSLVESLSDYIVLSYSNSQLNIDSKGEIIKRVEIYNTMGGLVYASDYNSNKVEILSSLDGILIIKIITKGDNITIKKIKI